MDPAMAYPLVLAPGDLLYTSQSNYFQQQTYAPYAFQFAPNSASQAQPHGGQFTINQSYVLDPLGPSPTPISHEHNGAESVNDSRTTSKMSMGPPTRPRKRKAPTLPADAWEPYKARIIELHNTQGLPLKEVKERIKDEYGFTAELRQYRTRISQWGKDKNIKPQEMRAIVRKRQHRELAEVNRGELVFEVRGVEVEPQKIDRWMKSHGVSENQLYAPSPAASTPSAVCCRTISERGSPVPNSIYSPAAPILSPGGIMSAAQSPAVSSPALPVSSIVRPQNSTFAGQSPAPTYLPLENFIPSSVPAPSLLQNQPDNATGVVHYRYKQTEEQNLREELLQAEFLFGTNHPETLGILHNLGVVLIDQGRYKSAEEVIRRLVEGRQTVGGNDDSNTFNALELLGMVLNYQGLYSKAEKLRKRTFESRKGMFGYEHPDTLRAMRNLGSTYWRQGRWKEAEELQMHVMVISKRVLGDEHLDTLRAMANLALTYHDQGRWKEAEELQVRVMEMRKRVLGDEHLDTIRAKINLAGTYHGQGRWKEAEELQVHVMVIRKRVLGDEHLDTIRAKINLASTYQSQGRWKEAEELQMHVMVIRKRVLGDEHPHTLGVMGNLASTYRSQGRWKEAEELQVQVIQVRKRVLGDEHPDTLTAMHNLAWTLKSQSRNEEAISLMETCFQLRQRILGHRHPKTESTLKTLNRWQMENVEMENVEMETLRWGFDADLTDILDRTPL